MTPPEDLDVNAAPPEAAVADFLELRVEDTLAAGRRLWVRGQVVRTASTTPESPGPAWRFWSKGRSDHLPEVLLETHLGGLVRDAKVTLDWDGRFEALLEADLPPAQSGWRMARHKVACGGQTVERAGLVLRPPRKAPQAVLVVLPFACAAQPGHLRGLTRSTDVRGPGLLLHQLREGPNGPLPVYYLACAAPARPGNPAELAVAAAALGWPHGHFLRLPALPDEFAHAAEAALDRLRWLFAGSADLLVLNLEAAAAGVLAKHLEPRDDRARVARLVAPNDDAGSAEAPFKEVRRPTASVVRPRRAVLVTKYPIVFCHGMLALSTLKMQVPEDLNCFYPLREYLRERGFRVWFPQVAPTSSVKERAGQLKEQVLRWTDEPVNVIAHSMGGLDARCMITHLNMSERVRSLTTISTPHRGTFLAEWFQDTYRRRVPLLPAMEAMGINMDGIRDCQRDACATFNEQTPDAAGVRYFSYGGAVTRARITPALRRGLNLLTPVEGPNDGLVSVKSAAWGEYLGTLQADHYAQTPDSVFVRPGEDFDALAFFSRLVEDLARRGF